MLNLEWQARRAVHAIEVGDSSELALAMADLRAAVEVLDKERTMALDAVTDAIDLYVVPSNDDIRVEEQPIVLNSPIGTWVNAWVLVPNPRMHS